MSTSATVGVVATDPTLDALAEVTEVLADARQKRYAAISDALAAGHPQHVVAAAAGMSASALSRMIRQDTARHPDQRLLPALCTGEVNGRLVRWFTAPLPFD